MTPEEIKKAVPVERLLAYLGSSEKKGKWRCLFPSHHTNGDLHHSVDVYENRAYCRSRNCFTEKGSDIFQIADSVKNLQHSFSKQKAWIEQTFGLTNGSHPKPEILRVYKWTDTEGRTAYHLRTNDPHHKFTWNQNPDGTGLWTLKPCKPDLYQRDLVKEAISVIVCAGERDCDILNGWLTELKLYPETVATTPYSGEASVKAEMLTLVHGKENVFVVGDNDQTGEAYREKVLGFLQGKVNALHYLRVPQVYNDMTEWAEQGGTAEDLQRLLNEAALAKCEGHEQGQRERQSVVFTTAATVTPLNTDWAWEGLIPLKALTVLAGNPGLGKSTITIEKAAQWSKGLVEGHLIGYPVDVAIASAEDSLAHTMVPRLMAAKGDLTRIHFIEMNRGGTRGPISIPEDVPVIAQAMQEKQARVLIVDPLACHLDGGINSWRDTDIRKALSPLADLAEALEAVVLVVVHLNKANHTEALYKVGGSTGIVAAARSVLLVAEDPEEEEAKVLTHLKCNLAPKAISQRYYTQEKVVSIDGKEIKTSAIVWGGEVPEFTASSVLNVRKDPEEQLAIQEAMEWLQSHLGDLALNTIDIIREAKKMGISERTLKRAKKNLGVEAFKQGFGKDGAWMWRLPVKEAKGGQDQPPKGQYQNPGTLNGTPQEKNSFSNELPKGGQQLDIDSLREAVGTVTEGANKKDLFEQGQEEYNPWS